MRLSQASDPSIPNEFCLEPFGTQPTFGWGTHFHKHIYQFGFYNLVCYKTKLQLCYRISYQPPLPTLA